MFNTVDNNILIDRLENWVGLSGTVLNWFRSYLSGRKFFLTIGDASGKYDLSFVLLREAASNF